MTEKVIREAKAVTQNPQAEAVPEVNTPSDLKFNITDCKLYVPVVALQEKFENNLYEELKTGILMDFTWGK